MSAWIRIFTGSLAFVGAIAGNFVAFAQDARIEFKGMPFGTPLEEFKRSNPLYTCLSPDSCSLDGLDATTHCLLLDQRAPSMGPRPECVAEVLRTATFGGARARLTVMFYEGKFSEAAIWLRPEGFDSVIEAVTARYGAPASSRTQVVQNRAGATFENRIVSWSIGPDYVQAHKYSSRITQSLIVLVSAGAKQRFQEMQEKKRRTAPRDL